MKRKFQGEILCAGFVRFVRHALSKPSRDGFF